MDEREMSPDQIAAALEKCDWSGVSIGNKAAIRSAINMLRTMPDAIEGALSYGHEGSNPPPYGHWLARFWNLGRETEQAARRTTPDREEIIEGCAKVCDDIAENMDKEPAAQYGADLCAERLRELKTAPTSAK